MQRADFTRNYQKLMGTFKDQSSAAKAIGVSQATISRYINGQMFMSVATAKDASKAAKGLFHASDLSPELSALSDEPEPIPAV